MSLLIRGDGMSAKYYFFLCVPYTAVAEAVTANGHFGTATSAEVHVQKGSSVGSPFPIPFRQQARLPDLDLPQALVRLEQEALAMVFFAWSRRGP